MENKIYEAAEVKEFHDKRNQKLNNARQAKVDAAVNKAASWLIRRLRKSKGSYIKVKYRCIRRKLGKWWRHMWELEECLREHGYHIDKCTFEESHWWSGKTTEVEYYLVGYNKKDIDFVMNPFSDIGDW